MKCTNCNEDLSPGELFCGGCGTPVPAQASNDSEAAAAARVAVPVQRGTYNAEISRQNPACLIFLIDQSGSMEEPIAGGTGEKKKQVVADAINRLLYNTVLRCAKEDGVRPYFDVGVWSYGGNEEVKAAFGQDLLSIKEI